MTSRSRFRQDATPLDGHAAVLAWHRIAPGSTVDFVEVLRRRNGKPTRKSSVYRLYGPMANGAAVIAKRGRRTDALVEKVVYEEILPGLPGERPQYYGYAEDTDADFGWLFLEHVTGEQYSASSEDHRELAARWFGRVHAAAAGRDLAGLLPAYGTDRYLEYLDRGRNRIRASAASSTLDRAGSTLAAIERSYDALESAWAQIEAFCTELPRTLVHGDFIGKNARVQGAGDRAALYVLDWESAGWSFPAEDIAGLDMHLYHSYVSSRWPQLDVPTLERLAIFGTIFQALALIDATSVGLSLGWVERTLADLESYESTLADARRRIGLGGRS